MKKSILEIVQIHQKLLDYFLSGVLAFVVLKTLREEFQRTQEQQDQIFLSALYISTYNTVVLALANTVNPNKDSIDLAYLFTCIKESKAKFDIGTFNRLSTFMQEVEDLITSIAPTIDTAITIRDTSVAHLDRRHINNPASLINDPPIKWIDMETAYDIVGSTLLETGRLLGSSDIAPYTSLANLALAQQTRKVFRLLYTSDKAISDNHNDIARSKMTSNPYEKSEQLADGLREAELVADKYFNSGLILIRTKDGWRAFLGNFKPEALVNIEKVLDDNVPSMEQIFKVSRKPNLIEELWRLLSNCMYFDGYIPMKFTEELDNEQQ